MAEVRTRLSEPASVTKSLRTNLRGPPLEGLLNLRAKFMTIQKKEAIDSLTHTEEALEINTTDKTSDLANEVAVTCTSINTETDSGYGTTPLDCDATKQTKTTLTFSRKPIPQQYLDRLFDIRALFTESLLDIMSTSHRPTRGASMKLKYADDDDGIYLVIQCDKRDKKRMRKFFAQSHVKETVGEDINIHITTGLRQLSTHELKVYTRAHGGVTSGTMVQIRGENGLSTATIGGAICVEKNGRKVLYGMTASHILSRLIDESGHQSSYPCIDPESDSDTSYDSDESSYFSDNDRSDELPGPSSQPILQIGSIAEHSIQSVSQPMNYDWALVELCPDHSACTLNQIYVDPEASPYSYGNLAHRPATGNDSQAFSLSSMEASLPSPFDRLHSNVNRTLTSSSSFRNDGLPGSYATSKASSAGAMLDVGYSSLQPGFEPAYSTSSIPFLYKPNEEAHPTMLTFTSLVPTPTPSEVKVIIPTSRGNQRGTLTPNTSSLYVAPGREPVETHDIVLDDGLSLEPGDSGSWVIQETTGVVYGHIVYADRFGEAYAMPFDHTLRDIQAQLQADRVGLPHEFDNSTDTWKWAMEAELQTAASETSCIGDNPYTMAELYDQPVELSQFSEFLAGLGAGLGMPIQLGPECPNPQMNDPSAAQMDREQSNGSSDSGYYTGFQPIGFSELGKRGPQVASLSPGISIAEPKYKRPKEPRVFCDQCNTHSEGFRGPHELKRHKQAVHEQRVKKFICVHPSTNGLKVETPIARPLEKCKSCNSQTKYGTHYNAAAHLRRCHFRGGPPRSTESSERRGGEGGGDWPPMSELSIWMKEIWVDKLDPMSSEHEKKSDKMMGVCSMDTVYPGLEHDGDQAGRLSALMNSGSYITVDPSGELTVVSPVDGSLNHNPIDF